MTTPSLTDRIEAYLRERPGRSWTVNAIMIALNTGEAPIDRSQVARAARKAEARLADTLSGRIVRAFRSTPQREWTVADLAEAVRPQTHTKLGTREYVSVVAKRVARELGWTRRLRIKSGLSITVYSPQSTEPQASFEEITP